MGCGCGKASDESIKKLTVEEQETSKSAHEEMKQSSSDLKADCVPRFTRLSQYEDFYYRNPSRPARNLDMLSLYSSCGLITPDPQSRPRTFLQLDYIYGYRCFLAGQNLYYSVSGETVLYPAAAVVVLLDRKSNTQSFLGGGELGAAKGHSDDIMTLAINPRRDLLASGEIGNNPLICIWRLEGDDSGKEVARLEQGSGTQAVAALCFSNDSKFLFAVDQSPSQFVRIYDWRESAVALLCVPVGKTRIRQVSCSPKISQFCAVGKEHFCFWMLRGTEVVKYKPSGSPHTSTVTMCVSQWLSNGNCLSGGTDGKIYLWIDRMFKHAYQVLEPEEEVSAMTVVSDMIVVGGRSHTVHVLNATFKEIAKYIVPDWVISLDKYGDRVLCGTRSGVIQEFAGYGRMVLMESHCEREVWSLALSPPYEDGQILLSTGDDNTIKAWDIAHKRCISTCILEARDVKPRTHRLSLLPLHQQSRALCISPKGHVAVALNDGRVTIRNNVHQLNLILTVLTECKDWVHCMSYSPAGNSLAISSQDSCVYIYNVAAGYRLFHQLSSAAPIVSLDWSKGEQYIKACDTSGTLLCWNVSTDTQQAEIPSDQWTTWTSSTGQAMLNIGKVRAEADFRTCVARSNDMRKLVVGNAWGVLEVFDCPGKEGGGANVYRGHSMEVVRAVWAKKDQVLLTAGGADLSIIQWKVT